MEPAYIMFEEILDEYKKEVREKLPKRDMSWFEIIPNAILILCAIAVCVGTIYFTYTKNSKAEQSLIKFIVIAIILTIVINEVQYAKQRETRLERHRERLKNLKELLKSRGWNSKEKIELLIEWCDSYSRMDSPWIKELEPVGKVFTVCIIPVISVAFQEIYAAQTQTEKQLEWLIAAVLAGLLGGIIAFVVLPALKDALNKKGKLAGDMKNDLKQILLINTLDTKTPENKQVQKKENGKKQ